MKFEQHRLDPSLAIPEQLRGRVRIVSRFWNGYLVHFVTGWPIVAEFLLPASMYEDRANSVGNILLEYILRLGMIQVTASDGFAVASTQAFGRILMSVTSTIAVAHPDVNVLTRDVIMGMPYYNSRAAGRANDETYKKANIPAFYIDNVKYKSVNKAYEVLRGHKSRVQNALAALKAQFFEQESNEPVQTTLNDRTIICRLPLV